MPSSECNERFFKKIFIWTFLGEKELFTRIIQKGLSCSIFSSSSFFGKKADCSDFDALLPRFIDVVAYPTGHLIVKRYQPLCSMFCHVMFLWLVGKSIVPYSNMVETNGIVWSLQRRMKGGERMRKKEKWEISNRNTKICLNLNFFGMHWTCV